MLTLRQAQGRLYLRSLSLAMFALALSSVAQAQQGKATTDPREGFGATCHSGS